MGKGRSSAPPPPDPARTAAAQAETNKETALHNAVLNNVNQITPYGNLTYTQTGGGKTYDEEAYQRALDAWVEAPQYREVAQGGLNGTRWEPVQAPNREDFLIGDLPPQFTATVELNPEQQAILDQQTANQSALVTLGGEQLGRIQEALSTPYSFDDIPDYTAEDQNAAAQSAQDAILSRLNPEFARDEEALRTRLANQGIMQGSEAYAREFEQFGETKNDARTQAILAGQQYGNSELAAALQRRNQSINEYNAERRAPLNEYIGTTSGVQVQNPSFSSQGYAGAAPVDYAGLVNQNYQAQVNQYNQQQAGRNSTIGSFLNAGATLGGAYIGGLFS